MFVVLILYMLVSIPSSNTLNNGLGRTPQMGMILYFHQCIRHIFFYNKGWNSWNHFHCNINEKVARQTADIIAASGLLKAGYQYGTLFLINR